jgi:hypothetical protein
MFFGTDYNYKTALSHNRVLHVDTRQSLTGDISKADIKSDLLRLTGILVINAKWTEFQSHVTQEH